MLRAPALTESEFMTFTEAALLVLRLAGKPLHYKELTDIAIEQSLLSHVGKSPEVTMGARLAAQVKAGDKSNPLKRVKPGVFALSEWDDKQVESGLADKTPGIDLVKKAQAALDTDATGADAPGGTEVQKAAEHRELDDQATPPDEEEQRRAELSASARELFESEDDDDQPILGPAPAAKKPTEEEDDDESERAEGKRRRRRRRSKKREDENQDDLDADADDLPGYTVSDAEPEDLPPADEVSPSIDIDDSQEPVSLSDLLVTQMSKSGSNRGTVALQSVADGLRKKLKGDSSLSAGGVSAIALADNLARTRRGQAPRFRLNGHQIALVEWSFDKRNRDRLVDADRAAEGLRTATVKALSDELKRLPQRAVGELCLVLLERMGVTQLGSVRRPGSHGSELHLSGMLGVPGAVEVPVAIMIRRDGRDIGRERITELRGAMHHYGQASAGWILSTGQVLSGAKEEAQAKGASPVTLTGRSELAELFVNHGIGVVTHHIEVPVLDAQLFDAFSGR